MLTQAKAAKDKGASRFCMGAAWTNPKQRDMPYIIEMVQGVKNMGLETCMTLGMLTGEQAQTLAGAGLDYYNHNLDTSPEFYGEIITTRTYQDRLDTLSHVRDAGMKVCCGGILGMGESANDRSALLMQLANLPEHPQSVPINMLVKVQGTPMENVEDLDGFEFIRTIAVARIMMPQSHVRLSAGRSRMNEQMQALCFMAGANSIFYGDKLLTTENPEADADMQLFAKLGLKPEQRHDVSDEAYEGITCETFLILTEALIEEELAQQMYAHYDPALPEHLYEAMMYFAEHSFKAAPEQYRFIGVEKADS